MTGRFRRTLDDLERSAHVPFDEQVQEQDADPPRDYLDPEDADRLRMLADPAGAWRLDPRR